MPKAYITKGKTTFRDMLASSQRLRDFREKFTTFTSGITSRSFVTAVGLSIVGYYALVLYGVLGVMQFAFLTLYVCRGLAVHGSFDAWLRAIDKRSFLTDSSTRILGVLLGSASVLWCLQSSGFLMNVSLQGTWACYVLMNAMFCFSLPLLRSLLPKSVDCPSLSTCWYHLIRGMRAPLTFFVTSRTQGSNPSPRQPVNPEKKKDKSGRVPVRTPNYLPKGDNASIKGEPLHDALGTDETEKDKSGQMSLGTPNQRMPLNDGLGTDEKEKDKSGRVPVGTPNYLPKGDNASIEGEPLHDALGTDETEKDKSGQMSLETPNQRMPLNDGFGTDEKEKDKSGQVSLEAPNQQMPLNDGLWIDEVEAVNHESDGDLLNRMAEAEAFPVIATSEKIERHYADMDAAQQDDQPQIDYDTGAQDAQQQEQVQADIKCEVFAALVLAYNLNVSQSRERGDTSDENVLQTVRERYSGQCEQVVLDEAIQSGHGIFQVARDQVAQGQTSQPEDWSENDDDAAIASLYEKSLAGFDEQKQSRVQSSPAVSLTNAAKAAVDGISGVIGTGNALFGQIIAAVRPPTDVQSEFPPEISELLLGLTPENSSSVIIGEVDMDALIPDTSLSSIDGGEDERIFNDVSSILVGDNSELLISQQPGQIEEQSGDGESVSSASSADVSYNSARSGQHGQVNRDDLQSGVTETGSENELSSSGSDYSR